MHMNLSAESRIDSWNKYDVEVKRSFDPGIINIEIYLQNIKKMFRFSSCSFLVKVV